MLFSILHFIKFILLREKKTIKSQLAQKKITKLKNYKMGYFDAIITF